MNKIMSLLQVHVLFEYFMNIIKFQRKDVSYSKELRKSIAIYAFTLLTITFLYMNE